MHDDRLRLALQLDFALEDRHLQLVGRRAEPHQRVATDHQVLVADGHE